MANKSGYVYGSAAPKLPEKSERIVRPENPGKQIVRKKVAVKAVPCTKYIPKAKMIIGVFIVAAIAFVIIYRFSAIAELNYQMGMLNDQYNQIRDENRKLKVDIETSINLDRVKEIAETKLNMHKPERYQLVLVNVPKNNYGVVMDQEYINEKVKETSLIENLVGIIKSVFP